MFKPFRITDNFESRVESLYKSSIVLSSGACVDVDWTDTSALTAVGYGSLIMGSVALASINANSLFPRELGLALPSVVSGGVPLIDRMLGLANSFFQIPTGMNLAIYKPVAGDVIATDQFVGDLPGDSGAAGKIDVTLAANLGKAVGINAGRFRLVQATAPADTLRARFVGITEGGNGVTLALFEYA